MSSVDSIDGPKKKTRVHRYYNKYLEIRRQYQAKSNSTSFANKMGSTPQNQANANQKAAQDKSEIKAKQNQQATDTQNITTPTALASASNNISVELNQVSPEVKARMLRKAKPFEKDIKAAAARYNLPEELIVGFMYQESRMNPKAKSHAGAMGLMQLMPGTAKQLGVANAWDPAQNINGGAKYIRQMFDKFGRLDFAAAAYNAGPGNVRKYGGIPPFRETQGYVPHVLGYAKAFAEAGGFNATADHQYANRAVPPSAVRA